MNTLPTLYTQEQREQYEAICYLRGFTENKVSDKLGNKENKN